jgi:creatinine amidohydrolase
VSRVYTQTSHHGSQVTQMTEVLLSRLTWPEVKEHLKKSDIILVPTGSNEQHGRHLPVDNDSFTALQVSKIVAEKTGVLVAPPVPFGYSSDHMGFPGTITISFETLVNIYKEVCKSLIKHGFRKIVIMNGHGGNRSAITEASRQIREETGIVVYSPTVFPGWWVPEVVRDTIKTDGGHSDEMETSVALYLGQRVLMEQAEKGVPPPSQNQVMQKYERKVPTPWNVHERSMSGSMGDPTLGTEEKGKKIMEAGIAEIVSFIEDLKRI